MGRFQQYLLSQTLCVIQTVHDWRYEDVAATFTQSAVVLTFLAGLRQQSQPDLGDGVGAGLLPEREKRV